VTASDPQVPDYGFDRRHWLERTGYLDRKLLFLDMHFWVRVREQETPDYVELSRMLREMVSEGRLICPVSPSLLMEVEKQGWLDCRTDTYRLMDDLSRGLSLRVPPYVFADEMVHVLRGDPIPRDVAYSHFFDAFSPGLALSFPENSLSAQQSREMADAIFGEMEGSTIRDVMASLRAEAGDGHIDPLRTGWKEMAEKETRWRQQRPMNAGEIEQAEFAATVDAFAPHLAGTLDAVGLDNLERAHTDNSPASIAARLNACPTFWCEYKLLSAARSNRPRMQENDFWDITHLSTALPYVDCATCDAAARHICTRVVRVQDRFPAVVLAKGGELLDWLRSL
jgi:hypothetical protein